MARRQRGLARRLLGPARPQPAFPAPTAHEREAYRILDFALRVGEILLSCGSGTADVEATVITAGQSCGLRRVEADVTFTSITASYWHDDEAAPVANIRVVRRRVSDYARLAATQNLVNDLRTGVIGRQEAFARLDEIERARHPYRPWLVNAASGMVSSAVSLQLGGGAVVALAAFVTTWFVMAVSARLWRRQIALFYLNVLGGAVATAVAAALTELDVPARPSLVVAGGIIMLLPGAALVAAVQDGITGFHITATARAFEVVLLSAGIVAGVAITLSAAVRLGVPMTLSGGTSSVSSFVVPLAAGTVAAVGAAVSMYAPPRVLLPVAVAAFAGRLVYSLLVEVHVGPATSAACAAVIIGLGAHVLSARWQVPGLILVVPGIIPLLPGLTTYEAIYRLSTGDGVGGLVDLLYAATLGLALASGVILGETLARPVQRGVDRLERRYAGPRLVDTGPIPRQHEPVVAPPEGAEPEPAAPPPLPDSGSAVPGTFVIDQDHEADLGGVEAPGPPRSPS